MKRLVAIQSIQQNVFSLKRTASHLPKTEKNAVLMDHWNVGVITHVVLPCCSQTVSRSQRFIFFQNLFEML